MVLKSYFAMSQQSNLGNWLIVFGNKEINEKINWHHEVQYRNYDAIGDLEQLLIRTGIGYNLTQNTNLLGGYGYILSDNYIANSNTKIDFEEHRIYQQLIIKNRINKLSVQHRYRFEQRFFGSDRPDQFKLRFRYFINMNLPITHFPNGRQLYLSAYNEVFLNTEGIIFDRNRLYGGLGFKLNKSLKFEIGYMNQLFTNSGRDQLNVVTFINW
jgi:hypothetical protein